MTEVVTRRPPATRLRIPQRQRSSTLFRSSAPLARWELWSLVAAIPMTATLALLRASSTLATTTVWAEDGREFLSDAVNHGVLGSLFRTYNGYLHIPARLVATLAATRLQDAAVVLSGLPCLIVACLAGFVYVATAPFLPSRVLRATLALSMALLPTAASETLANAANLHWFLIFAAFWATLWVPRSWAMRIVCGAIVLFALTSDPFPLVFAPLVLFRLAMPLPQRDRFPLPIAFGLGAAMQIVAGVVSHRPLPPPSFAGALKLYPLRVVLSSATGFRGPSFLFQHVGWLIVVVAAIGGVALLAALFLLGDRRELAVPILAVGFSLAMFVLYAGLRWTDGLEPVRGELVMHTDSRYSVAPSLLLLSAVFMLATRLRAPTLRAVVTGALVLAVAATWVVDFRVPTTRNGNPTWAESMHNAARICAHGATRVLVEVQPYSRPVPWAVALPCRAL